MRKFLKPIYALPVTAAICLSAIGFSVASHIYALNSGQEITVPARGYDPRDLLLGHYVRLTPDLRTELSVEASKAAQLAFDLGEAKWSTVNGWVKIEHLNGVWQTTGVFPEQPDIRPSDDVVFLKGEIVLRRVLRRDDQPKTYTVTPPLHIDRYYANVDEALKLETLMRNRDGDQNQLNLILSVSKDGTARLKGLEVEGQRQVMGWW